MTDQTTYYKQRLRRLAYQQKLDPEDFALLNDASNHISTQAERIAQLKARSAEAKIERVAFKAFDWGYEKGHNDTVESAYCPPSEYPEDFGEVYRDLLETLEGEGE